jgi:hypothetical protein
VAYSTFHVPIRTALVSPPYGPAALWTIAHLSGKAEATARNAAAAWALAAYVQLGLRLAERLLATDRASLVLRKPLGGIGTADRIVRTFAPLAVGGLYRAAMLVASGSWQDEKALRGPVGHRWKAGCPRFADRQAEDGPADGQDEAELSF